MFFIGTLRTLGTGKMGVVEAKLQTSLSCYEMLGRTGDYCLIIFWVAVKPSDCLNLTK